MKIITFDTCSFNASCNNDKEKSLSIYPESTLHVLPDSALLIPKRPLFLPDLQGPIKAYAAWAIRVNRLGRCISERFAERYYDKVSIAACLVAEGFCEQMRSLNGSDIAAYSFDGAVCLGEWINASESEALEGAIQIEDQKALLKECDWKEKADKAITLLSKYQTIRQGDIIILKTESSLNLSINNHLKGVLNGTELLSVNLK